LDEYKFDRIVLIIAQDMLLLSKTECLWDIHSSDRPTEYNLGSAVCQYRENFLEGARRAPVIPLVQQTLSFMDLPAEVRNMIYREAFRPETLCMYQPEGCLVRVKSRHRTEKGEEKTPQSPNYLALDLERLAQPPLSLLNSEIEREALPILFRSNRWRKLHIIDNGWNEPRTDDNSSPEHKPRSPRLVSLASEIVHMIIDVHDEEQRCCLRWIIDVDPNGPISVVPQCLRYHVYGSKRLGSSLTFYTGFLGGSERILTKPLVNMINSSGGRRLCYKDIDKLSFDLGTWAFGDSLPQGWAVDESEWCELSSESDWRVSVTPENT